MKEAANHINIFIAYSRRDKSYLEKLRIYLKPLERKRTINIWYDGEIVAGSEWEKQIKLHLSEADIILLLLSAYSLASDYFYNKEMQSALASHKAGRAIVIPVMLRSCAWEETPLIDLQVLPTNARPISSWSDEADAYTDIVKGVRKSIEMFKKSGTNAENSSTKSKKTIPETSTKKSESDSRFSRPIEELLENMVEVEGGSFEMGCTPEQGKGRENEKPVHEVSLDSYKLGKYQVTQEQWRAVMDSDPKALRFKGFDRCPVEGVNWNEIQDFLKKLNSLTGLNFRLPTEAEWEYAARGGNKSIEYKYSGSNNIDEVAWYGGNSGNKTHPVGEKKGNELGLYDMSGNVWEWCNDWYASDYYENSPKKNPQGPKKGRNRVLRGGSWSAINSEYCRVANRRRHNPHGRINSYGFRVASSL